MDKQIIKDVIKEMILDGEIKITTSNEGVYSNEGHYYGDEKALLLSVEKETGELDWDDEPIIKNVKQNYRDGVVLNEIEITGW